MTIGLEVVAGQVSVGVGPFASEALATPYAEEIGRADRQAGLALLWSEVRFNFSNFDQLAGLDWDSLYFAFIPRVDVAEGTLAYYRVLQEFTAHLRDGHTRVMLPPDLAHLEDGRAPLQTRLTEGRVIVHEVYDDVVPAVAGLGLRPGLEVLAVDGVPVFEYVAQRVAPFRGSNTPQGRDRYLYEYALLRGPVGADVTLELQEEEGSRRSVSLPRLERIPGGRPLVEFTEVDEGIGLLTLRSFGWDEVVAAVDSLFDAVSATDGLIIDLRENGGGDGRIGWTILGFLTDQDLTYQQWFSREYRPIWRAWGRPERRYRVAPGTWPADIASMTNPSSS